MIKYFHYTHKNGGYTIRATWAHPDIRNMGTAVAVLITEDKKNDEQLAKDIVDGLNIIYNRRYNDPEEVQDV